MFPTIRYFAGKTLVTVGIPKPFDCLTARTVPFKPDYQNQINTNLLAKRARIEARLEKVDG